MRFLITGGAGFIGSAVIRYLINHTQYSVVNVDKLTYAGNLEALSSVSDNSRYAFEQVDICDAAEIKRIFAEYQPDVVMHLAAESHVDRSIDGPAEFIQTNIVGTYVLLEAAREYWSGLESDKKARFRFHHVSTDEVYGDLPHPDDFEAQDVGADHRVCPEGSRQSSTRTKVLSVNSEESRQSASRVKALNINSDMFFTEQTAYAPSSPYSASKASSDHLVRAWQRTYGLPTLITNCSNNYGPYQFPEKLIPLIILNALEGKSLPIYGDGSQIRDWLYVDDHARALVLVAEQGKVGETYNIGGHNEKRNIEVVETICEILDELVPLGARRCSPPTQENSVGSTSVSSYKYLIAFVKDRPGHDRRYAIDASKIERKLGWKPEESFESGLRKTVEWYLDNQEWCQHVLVGES